MVCGLLRQTGYLLQIQPRSRGSTCYLVYVYDACHTPAPVARLLRAAGHIVAPQHHGRGNSVKIGHFAGQRQVHHISGIVTVHTQHAAAKVTGANHFGHAPCRG